MITARDITPVIMVGKPQAQDDFFFMQQRRPRPFVKLISSYSPFQQAVFHTLPFQKPVIVCHEKYQVIAQEQLDEIGIEARCIILEPQQKGSAAALAMASFYLKKENKLMVVMPCYSLNKDPFQDILDAALYADQRIVLIGKRVIKSQKKYGYILSDYKEGERCHSVWAFIDQPNKTGEKILRRASGSMWNTGFMVCRPRYFLGLLEKSDFQTYKACERSFYAGEKHHHYLRAEPKNYAAAKVSTLGLSVMERAKEVCVVEMKGDI